MTIETHLDQPSAFTRNEIIATFSRSTLDNAVAQGRAERILPGVYAAPFHARSFRVRAHAALLWAGPDAALAGLSALFEYGVVERTPQTIDIVVPHGRRLERPSWLTIRRSTVEIPAQERRGLRLVTPAYALVHGYADVPPHLRAEAVYKALRMRLVYAAQLRAALTASPRVRARPELMRRIEAAAKGARSYLEEHALYRVFNTAPFAGFLRQHEVVHEGQAYYLDMFHAGTKTAVELDGDGPHGRPEQRAWDIRRDAVLATRGILTLRYGFTTLVEAPQWCRDNLLLVLRARGG